MYTCRICGNTQNNSLYIGKERMFGLYDEFLYFKCSDCGCLQIKDIPDDMDKYYPFDYYSYLSKDNSLSLKGRIANYLLKKALKTRLGKRNLIGDLACLYNRYYKDAYFYLDKSTCNYDSKVLDIGCGNGGLLNQMSLLGFRYLTGVDPYLEKDIHYSNGVNVLKKDMFDISSQYDLIMLHHSFEHMTNPYKVFAHLHQILTDEGVVIIRIPLIDSYAWRKYNMNWFQIDAPRHFYLHSVKSISCLANKTKFVINKIDFDSSEGQFIHSEKYLRNISLYEGYDIPKDVLAAFKKKSEELNLLMDGDQACFYLKKDKR